MKSHPSAYVSPLPRHKSGNISSLPGWGDGLTIGPGVLWMRDKGTTNTKQKHHDDGTSFLVRKLSFVGMEKGKTQTAVFEAVKNNNNFTNNNIKLSLWGDILWNITKSLSPSPNMTIWRQLNELDLLLDLFSRLLYLLILLTLTSLGSLGLKRGVDMGWLGDLAENFLDDQNCSMLIHVEEIWSFHCYWGIKPSYEIQHKICVTRKFPGQGWSFVVVPTLKQRHEMKSNDIKWHEMTVYTLQWNIITISTFMTWMEWVMETTWRLQELGQIE